MALGRALALAAIVVAFMQRSLGASQANWDVTDADQSGFLRLALKINAGDGFANGKYNPLLPLTLQPVVGSDWAFFTRAKLVGIGIATLGLLVVYGLGRRLFGPVPALLAVALLAANPEIVRRAARTEPEALLVVVFFAAWCTWTIGFRDERYWWAAGPLAALAYMAKGTGALFLPAFLIVPMLRDGPRALRRRGPWILVGLYLLTASPFLVSNQREFGSPFYAFPSAHAMWYDDWDDRYASPDGRHITMRTYLETHTAAQSLRRAATGAVSVTGMWRDALAPWSSAPVAQLAVVAWLALAVAGLAAVVRPDRAPPDGAALRTALIDSVWTALALALPMHLLFGWYMPISASPRYELPMVAVLYLIGAAFGVFGLRSLVRAVPQKRAHAAELGLCAAVILIAALSMLRAPWASPSEIRLSDRAQNGPSVAAVEWLSTARPQPEQVIWGPGDLATFPLYDQVSFEPIPTTVTDWDSFDAFIGDEGASHVMLAPEMVADREALLGSYFTPEDGLVAFTNLPPGWELAFAYPTDEQPRDSIRRCRVCVFRVQAANSDR